MAANDDNDVCRLGAHRYELRRASSDEQQPSTQDMHDISYKRSEQWPTWLRGAKTTLQRRPSHPVPTLESSTTRQIETKKIHPISNDTLCGLSF